MKDNVACKILGLDEDSNNVHDFARVIKAVRYTNKIKEHGNAIDTLYALIKRGPLEIGDVPSKAGLDTLLQLGIAVECYINNGEQHFVASTRGWDVYRLTANQ